MKGILRAMLLALCVLSTLAAADELVLPPGGRVVIFDAADPSVRLLITAPPNAPVDLTPLLSMKAGESVYSIVTQVQLNQAGGMTMEPDGSVSLRAAPTNTARRPTPGLAGGVLVYNAGKWTLHRASTSNAANAAATAAQPAQQRVTIFKPGVTRDQVERDLAQCRGYSVKAAEQQFKPADRAATYNASMYSCLRNFGYEIRS